MNPPATLDRERLITLINNMSDAVIATDERLNIILYNGVALNLLNRNESLDGKPLYDIMPLIDSNNQPLSLKDIADATTSTTVSRDYRLAYGKNDTINIYLNLTRVTGGYGSDVGGFTLIMRDITSEKSIEEERDEFVSVVSHELRTPIAVAEGDVSNAMVLLKKKVSLDEVETSLGEAHLQIMFLSNLVNDLATLSRAERGKLQLDLQQIDAKTFIDSLEHEYKPQAEEKGLEFRVKLPAYLPSITSSELYMREIMQNFITNAIKYTEKGFVAISAESSDPKELILTVADSGIGISKADQEKVFDKFFRSEDFRTREHSGTGLGLYVTAKLARLIHADISLESELNEGSKFTIKVPSLAPQSSPAAPAQAAA